MLVILDVLGEDNFSNQNPDQTCKKKTPDKNIEIDHKKQTQLQIITIDGKIIPAY